MHSESPLLLGTGYGIAGTVGGTSYSIILGLPPLGIGYGIAGTTEGPAIVLLFRVSPPLGIGYGIAGGRDQA